MDVRFPAACGEISQQPFSKTNLVALPVIMAIVKRARILKVSDAGGLWGVFERRLALGDPAGPVEVE
jgi:hypothetical protein